jgi:putative copper export protein
MGRRRNSAFRRNHVFSIVIGFGVATLFATGILIVVQIVDDFRGA